MLRLLDLLRLSRERLRLSLRFPLLELRLLLRDLRFSGLLFRSPDERRLDFLSGVGLLEDFFDFFSGVGLLDEFLDFLIGVGLLDDFLDFFTGVGLLDRPFRSF